MNDKLLQDVINCDVFKVGNFKLKSGSFSPVYIDLRRIISYPNVVKDLANAIKEKLVLDNVEFDVVCGVPYTALPLASVFSVFNNVKMVMKRKEAKDHGLKKMVEGNICVGDTCLIIEDIISSGTSIIETAEALRREGLKVKECIVVVNRNQGGLENLKKAEIKLHSLFDIKDIFQTYCKINKVEKDLIEQVNCYFKDNSYLPVLKESPSTKSFLERSNICTHQTGKNLFQLMERKKTNLCVAVDTESSKVLLDLADRLGPLICILKTHIDMLKDFSLDVVSKLKELSKTHSFLIMEDRKFADIGNTVKKQVCGLYRINSLADLVTAHAIAGPGMLHALQEENCAIVLVAEMSSKGTLATDEYKEKALKMAEANADCIVGYVAQKGDPGSNFIHMCPGVNISSPGDTLGQQYKSPEEAVANGADIIIVGRGICEASDIEGMATQYKERGFNAYLKRISS